MTRPILKAAKGKTIDTVEEYRNDLNKITLKINFTDGTKLIGVYSTEEYGIDCYFVFEPRLIGVISHEN
jgi:hypothetical protein